MPAGRSLTNGVPAIRGDYWLTPLDGGRFKKRNYVWKIPGEAKEFFRQGDLGDLDAAKVVMLPAWIEHQPRLALRAR